MQYYYNRWNNLYLSQNHQEFAWYIPGYQFQQYYTCDYTYSAYYAYQQEQAFIQEGAANAIAQDTSEYLKSSQHQSQQNDYSLQRDQENFSSQQECDREYMEKVLKMLLDHDY